jgi:hypothetical protein
MEDEYLARIGEVAYSVSYLEWTIFGDLRASPTGCRMTSS